MKREMSGVFSRASQSNQVQQIDALHRRGFALVRTVLHFSCNQTYIPMPKRKQLLADEQKTVSIAETPMLRLLVVRPGKGIIELVNVADQGRVCTLRTGDFRSVKDALAYAELLRLAPELLEFYLSDTKRLEEVLARLEKRAAGAAGKGGNVKMRT
jgi:hypothetical protein